MLGHYTQLSYRDERIGEWKTTIRANQQPDWCLWEAQRVLENQPTETFFALSGDVHGPDPALLDQVYRVLSNLGAIIEIVDSEIRKLASSAATDLFVSAIRDWDRHDNVLQIELAPFGRRVLEQEKMLLWPGVNPDLDHRVVIRTHGDRISPGQLVERGLV